ncbi:MAG: sigma-70 family RNA polymerase sigma factor [Bryobacteraceae bacterium]|nr:sigma-70 family RNA polymerase sigma factor [Bryobacteraceae bacterium]
MDSNEVTLLLERSRQGDENAINLLVPLVYDELRRLAHSYLRGQAQTIQATALVNEAYIKLIEGREQAINNRAHFFALAARVMRQIIVDYARTKGAQKRGSGMANLELKEEILSLDQDSEQVLAIHEALDRLAVHDARKARLIEMRFFGGMTAEECADSLADGTTAAQVYRELRLAQAWLHQELQA